MLNGLRQFAIAEFVSFFFFANHVKAKFEQVILQAELMQSMNIFLK